MKDLKYNIVESIVGATDTGKEHLQKEITDWFIANVGAKDTAKNLSFNDDLSVNWKTELAFVDCTFTELPDFITIKEIGGRLFFKKCAIENFRGFPDEVGTHGVRGFGAAFTLLFCNNIVDLNYLPSIKKCANNVDYSIEYNGNLRSISAPKVKYAPKNCSNLSFSVGAGWNSEQDHISCTTGKEFFNKRVIYGKPISDSDFRKVFNGFVNAVGNTEIMGEYTNPEGQTWSIDTKLYGNKKHLIQEEKGEKKHVGTHYVERRPGVWQEDYENGSYDDKIFAPI